MSLFKQIKLQQQIQFLYGYWKTNKSIYEPALNRVAVFNQRLVIKLASRLSVKFAIQLKKELYV